MKRLSVIALLVVISIFANATELFVGTGQQFSTIQSAIDAAQNGDIVTVMDGTYIENLVITDKSITLRSNCGNENCVIDGNYIGHVIKIESIAPDEEAVIIQGFTIKNSGTYIDFNSGSYNDIFDSGIFVKSVRNTKIQGNNFLNNLRDIYLRDSSDLIEIIENTFNEIMNNQSLGAAGYIYCLYFEKLIITDNQFNDSSIQSSLQDFVFGTNGNNVNFTNNDVNLCRSGFSKFRYIQEINIIANNIEYSGWTGIAGIAFSFFCSNFELKGNTIRFEEFSGRAISVETYEDRTAYVYNNLIYGSSTAIHFECGSSAACYHGYFRNNTFKSCETVFYIENFSNYNPQNNILEFKNNIIWDVDTIFDLNNHNLATPVTIEYSCLEGGFPTGASFIDGGGNTSNNPQLTTDYHLSSNSIYCIDLAHPDTDGDGIEWIHDEDDRDVDGSRKDMGFYPYLHEHDTKVFTKGVHWISFPILCQDGTYNGIPSIPPIDDQLFQQAYYDNGSGLLQLTGNSLGTIDGFEKIIGKRNSIYMSIIPDDYNYAEYDIEFGNMLFRHEGYKISIGEVTNPTVLIVGGSNDERLPENHVISGNLPYGEYHWIGYWLKESKNIVDAFGGNSDNPADDIWQYVEKVKAEDWYYDRCSSGIRGDIPSVSWLTTGKTMEYGKMYLVWFLDHTLSDFQWYTEGASEEPAKKKESEYFSYTELPDYEVIDVLDIPEDVREIGVFEEESCVGAVVVQNSSEQILVYSNKANRDDIPFNFEIVTGNKGLIQPVKNYLVFNNDTENFEKGHVASGRQERTSIKLGDTGEPQNDTPAANSVVLHNSYPNPFNPETNISFSLPAEQEVSLNIYNLKGQRVRELVNGQMVSGTYTIIWDGKNDGGKQVGSGLYFYKLRTDGREFSKKMLLLNKMRRADGEIVLSAKF